MKNYVALYEREPDGSAWNVSFPDAPGTFTWGRTLAQAKNRAVEAMAYHLGIAPADVTIEDDVRVDAAVDTEIHAAVAARRDLAEHVAAVQAATAAAAVTLVRKCGLSQRDAGVILGLSHQRIDQLVG